MPIAHIHIAAGRPAEKVEAMAAAVTETIARTLDAPPETVRVLVTVVDKGLWFSGGVSLASRGR